MIDMVVGAVGTEGTGAASDLSVYGGRADESEETTRHLTSFVALRAVDYG